MRLKAKTVPHFKAELTANAGGINLDSVVDSIGGALGNSGQRVTDVEEFHTQIRHVLGHRPEIVHEETKAVVRPATGSDSRPEIEIVSNDVKRGIFGNGVESLLGNPLEIFRRTNARIDDDLADLLGADTNSSTTTNVINIFTFNIYVHNATAGKEEHPVQRLSPITQILQRQQQQQQNGQPLFSYTSSLGHPFMTRLQSTSQVNSPAQSVLSSHHYKANVREHTPVKQPPSPSLFPMEMFPSGSENFLTQLMKRQMNGGADTISLTRAALGRRRRLEDEDEPPAAAVDDIPETSRSSNANARPAVTLFRAEARSGNPSSGDDFGSVFFRQFLPDTPVGPQIITPKNKTPVGPQIIAPRKQAIADEAEEYGYDGEREEESDEGHGTKTNGTAKKPVRMQGFLELADFSFLDHTDDEELSASNANPPPITIRPFPNPRANESIYDPSYLIRILADKHVDIEVKEKIVRPLALTAIPSLFAVAGATSPLWMPFMGGKKRRRRRRNVGDNKHGEISKYWLSYLLGSRYDDGIPQIDDNSADVVTTNAPPTTRRISLVWIL